MNDVLLKNCLIINEKKEKIVDILISNGIIIKISNGITGSSVATIIDCKKRLVLPGFIDAHTHIPGNMLYDYCGINLSNCKTFREYIESISQYKLHNPSNQVVLGFGWSDEIVYKSIEYKNSENIANVIDKIYPHNPVVLYSIDFHSALCNSCALKLLGINSNSEAPLNGIFELDKNGQLSGILRGSATKLIEKRDDLFSFSEEQFEVAFKKYQEQMLSLGITSVNTFMFIGINEKKAWAVIKKIESKNELIININGFVLAEPDDEPKDVLNKYIMMQSLNSDKIRINSVKIYIDGVVENKTAYLKEPYKDSHDYIGMLLWDKNKLYQLCNILNNNLIQIHAHAIGDAAVNTILESIDSVENKDNVRKSRDVITHIQLIDKKDVKLFQKNRVIACVQPFWINYDLNDHSLDYMMLGDRAYEEYPIGSLISDGVILTSSSDCPVTENPLPFIAIDKAVRRCGKEKASVYDMIDSFTVNSAYQLKRENEVGKIIEGFKADLIVASQDFTHDNNIVRTECVLTVVDGRIVYNKLMED